MHIHLTVINSLLYAITKSLFGRIQISYKKPVAVPATFLPYGLRNYHQRNDTNCFT